MTMPTIENRWTTGNLLTLIALGIQLLGFIIGGTWFASELQGSVAEVVKSADGNKQQIVEIQREVQRQSIRLQASENNYGRMDERLIAMQNILVSIDRRLEQLREP